MKIIYVENSRRQCGRCAKPLRRCVGAVGETSHPIICWICWTYHYPTEHFTISWQCEYFAAAEEAVAPPEKKPAERFADDIPF